MAFDGLKSLHFDGPYLSAKQPDVCPPCIYASNGCDRTLQVIQKLDRWLDLVEAIFIASQQVAHLRTAPGMNRSGHLVRRLVGGRIRALRTGCAMQQYSEADDGRYSVQHD